MPGGARDMLLRFLHLGEVRPARSFELRLDRLARQLIVPPEIVIESGDRIRQRLVQLLDRALQDVARTPSCPPIWEAGFRPYCEA